MTGDFIISGPFHRHLTQWWHLIPGCSSFVVYCSFRGNGFYLTCNYQAESTVCKVMLSPSTHLLRLVFIRAPGSSLAVRGPLRLQRSQHYQPPPSLWWQLSSLCLPGLQPLPPPALSPLVFTVPETTQHHARTSVCAVLLYVHYSFVPAVIRDGCDVCWDLWSCRQVVDLLSVDKQCSSGAVRGQPEQLVVYSLSFFIVL